MKHIFWFLLVLGIGCIESSLDESEIICDNSNPEYFSPDQRTFIPPSKGDFILTLKDRSTPENIDGYFDLDFSLICKIQENFGKVQALALENYCWAEFTELNLEKYYYQFLGVYIDDVKHIYVNALTHPEVDSTNSFRDWLIEPIDTFGGGHLFWGALFNLETLDFGSLEFNSTLDHIILDPTPQNKFENLCTRAIPRGLESYFRAAQEDICHIETHFDKLRGLQSTGLNFNGRQITFSYGYFYQYLGVVLNGKRYIYLNAAGKRFLYDQSPGSIWYRRLYGPCDGGYVYWGVLFDLEDFVFSGLEFNGVR